MEQILDKSLRYNFTKATSTSTKRQVETKTLFKVLQGCITKYLSNYITFITTMQKASIPGC